MKLTKRFAAISTAAAAAVLFSAGGAQAQDDGDSPSLPGSPALIQICAPIGQAGDGNTINGNQNINCNLNNGGTNNNNNNNNNGNGTNNNNNNNNNNGAGTNNNNNGKTAADCSDGKSAALIAWVIDAMKESQPNAPLQALDVCADATD
ncbi:hypothetical protein [Streptomyces carpinensis]|uniref:Secreted protein n=1 Tax=Streptomyces carpinensis TaxID=66369 RepID=A0ABV1W4F0_9ACTN|nr:hypothetical protein [Streptomyces carpinensis]